MVIPKIRVNKAPPSFADAEARRKRLLTLAKQVMERGPNTQNPMALNPNNSIASCAGNASQRTNITACVTVLLIGLFVGIGVGIAFAGRYSIVNARLPLRIDKWTGKSWVYSYGEKEWTELTISKTPSRSEPPFDPDKYLREHP